MKNRLFVLLVLVAAACAGCDGISPVGPSGVRVSPPARFSVRQMFTLPVDGATLDYGQPGRVEVAYTLRDDEESPAPPPGSDYLHVLPRQYLPRPIYQVMSCLSLDGRTCIVNGSALTITGSDGTVWNTLALADTFRGRVDQTAFVLHQLTVTRAGLTDVVAREEKALHWHFK